MTDSLKALPSAFDYDAVFRERTLVIGYLNQLIALIESHVCPMCRKGTASNKHFEACVYERNIKLMASKVPGIILPP